MKVRMITLNDLTSINEEAMVGLGRALARSKRSEGVSANQRIQAVRMWYQVIQGLEKAILLKQRHGKSCLVGSTIYD
jgi:hypothetical protein